MDKRNEHLPAESDAKRGKNDNQFKAQEEFDDRSGEQLDNQTRNQDRAKTKQQGESQTRHEDMIPSEKKKQSPKWDKVDRKLPQIKK